MHSFHWNAGISSVYKGHKKKKGRRISSNWYQSPSIPGLILVYICARISLTFHPTFLFIHHHPQSTSPFSCINLTISTHASKVIKASRLISNLQNRTRPAPTPRPRTHHKKRLPMQYIYPILRYAFLCQYASVLINERTARFSSTTLMPFAHPVYPDQQDPHVEAR